MDTPQKNFIGTPGSIIEESPVFNYLSNLSPIKPVKSIHISQSFTSLNFTSPSSVFTSPQVVSSFKDSSFLKSHKFSDRSKYDDSDEGNKHKSSEELTGSSQLLKNAVKNEFDLEHSTDEVPKDLARTLEYDYATPASESKSQLYTGQYDRDSVEASDSHTPFGPGVSKERLCISDAAPGTYQNTPQRERLRLHWDTLATDTPGSLFIGTPNETRAFQSLFDKSLNTGENPGSLSSLFPDNNDDLQLAQPVCKTETGGVDMGQLVNPAEDKGPLDLGWQLESIPTSLEEQTDNSSVANIDDQASNSHQGVRRRCLTFESLNWQKKSLSSVTNQLPSVLLQLEEKGVSRFKRPYPIKPVSGRSSKSVKPGIGLHLNALATAKVEPIVLPPRVELSSSSSNAPFGPSATFQELTSEPFQSASSVTDAGSSGKDSQVSEDDLLAIVPSDDLNAASPQKKKLKLLSSGDDESCKRCNCKKSKCLKLYCECFAAGVYCIEPCSCQDCFNKPVHEETVLATRRQIEARNPLAFAPKVIRASQATPDVGVELANTPASARHKRGCNCKKSSCLKKYCECYQGGVGCSFNCRCENCKNTFGRKDGLDVDLEIQVNAEIADEEEPQEAEKSVAEEDLQKAVVRINEDCNLDASFPATPSRLSRLSVKLQFPSKGKPMRSSFLSIGSSAGSLNDTRGVNFSSIPRPPKFEESQSSIPSDDIPELLQSQGSPSNVIKTNSPNGKRVSPPQCKSTRPSPSRRSTRRVILQAIPSFPKINNDQSVYQGIKQHHLQRHNLLKAVELEM